jgi:hypothetical protein
MVFGVGLVRGLQPGVPGRPLFDERARTLPRIAREKQATVDAISSAIAVVGSLCAPDSSARLAIAIGMGAFAMIGVAERALLHGKKGAAGRGAERDRIRADRYPRQTEAGWRRRGRAARTPGARLVRGRAVLSCAFEMTGPW